MDPSDILLRGTKVLDPVLVAHGFTFRLEAEGVGSGGHFARGAYRCGRLWRRRRLELHFRASLGLVSYAIGRASASHKRYMRELGVLDQCEYPGRPDDPLSGFRHLAADLEAHAADFLTGDCSMLRKAAAKEAAERRRGWGLPFFSVDADLHKRERARERFRERDWNAVVKLLRSVRRPEDLRASEKKMLKIALERRSQK